MFIGQFKFVLTTAKIKNHLKHLKGYGGCYSYDKIPPIDPNSNRQVYVVINTDVAAIKVIIGLVFPFLKRNVCI